MRLRFGLFSWAVIGVVLALIAAAVLTANLARPATIDAAAMVEPDSPAAPVVAAYLAVQEGDAATARAQFTEESLEQMDKQGWDPIASAAGSGFNHMSSRRVRIVEVSEAQVDASGEEYAYVSLAEDNFSNAGLFGRSVYTNERTVRVVRVDGVWLVDDVSLFY